MECGRLKFCFASISESALRSNVEVWGDLVALLVFKTSVGLNKVSGGFDSHPPPPQFDVPCGGDEFLNRL